MDTQIINLTAPVQEVSSILLKKVTGEIATQTLDRSASTLAENVQQAMDAIYVLQKSFISDKTTSNVSLIQLQTAKERFRTECENMRKMLQDSYRHATYLATSSLLDVSDRSLAMKGCHFSAKGVCRDIQKIIKVFEGIIVGFQRDPAPSEIECSRSESGRVWSSLEAVQSSLRDIRAFWEDHLRFLTMIVNNQADLPGPGEQSKQISELWTKYQVALLEAISSITESSDGLSVTPTLVHANSK